MEILKTMSSLRQNFTEIIARGVGAEPGPRPLQRPPLWEGPGAQWPGGPSGQARWWLCPGMSPLGPQGPGSEPGLQLPAQAGGWGWKGSLVLKGPPFGRPCGCAHPTSPAWSGSGGRSSALGVVPPPALPAGPCGWRGVVRAAPQPGGQHGNGGEWGYPYSGPWWGRACVSGRPLSLQNSGVGWNGTRSKGWMWGLPLLQDPAGPRGTPGPPPGPIGSGRFPECRTLDWEGVWGSWGASRISLGLWILGVGGGRQQSLVSSEDPRPLPTQRAGRGPVCLCVGWGVTCPGAPSPRLPTGPGIPQCSCLQYGQSQTCRSRRGQSHSPPSNLVGKGALQTPGPERLVGLGVTPAC